MFTRYNVIQILKDIQYKDWELTVGNISDMDRPMYLQVRFIDANGDVQKGRKWMLSQHMTKSEIVQTAFKAILTAEEHEAREQFRYKGRLVYGPHIDVDVLASVVGDKENLDMRTGVWVA